MEKERTQPGGLPQKVIRLIGDMRAALLTLVDAQRGHGEESDAQAKALREDLVRLDPSQPIAPRAKALVALTEGSQARRLNAGRSAEFAEIFFERLTALAEQFTRSYPSSEALAAIQARIAAHACEPHRNLLQGLEDMSALNATIQAVRDEEQRAMRAYVGEVQERLADIDAVISASCAASTSAQDAQRREDAARDGDIRAMQETVRSSESFESLRGAMGSALSTLTSRMLAFREQQVNRETHAAEESARARHELETVKAELSKKAEALYSDPLTGVPNRLAFQEHANAAYQRWRHCPVSNRTAITVIDIDFFKSVNDHFGHAEGDRVLCAVAHALRDNLREGDFLARWGGEEFVIVSERSTSVDASHMAARLRKALATLSLTSADGRAIPITASCGVAELCDGMSMDDAFERADRALYRVKESGRDGLAVHHAGTRKAVLLFSGKRTHPEYPEAEAHRA
ncbi:diguanylate cyclase (GGDEF)-like protein [Natronocella acetinitrilica]|uniref:diguanylate cyclase n=1 Tax=Natronocella acetinitrilica TaxID=414046 RepID=A0AAE3G670_9GAMM|nr:GGDEF domain-containing protein [Natronocella acetinitrilica]MCP1674622.1 diguanylate cyclase (GGDEF)-like protein [Natronocella acetinitrilica]